jgi:hypothetical protein
MKTQNIFLLLIPFVVLLFFIIIPASISYASDNPKSFVNEISNGGLAGYAYSNGTVVVLDNSTITLRHELCHIWMFNHNVTNMFYQEAGCYTAQWFIWNKVNLTSLNYE